MKKGTEIKVLDHGFVRLIDWMGDDQRQRACTTTITTKNNE